MTQTLAAVQTERRFTGALRHRVGISVVLLVIVFSPVWNLHVINKDMALSKVDLVQVWVGVRSTLAGHDPYSAEATREIQLIYYHEVVPDSDPVPSQRFIYPAHIAFILAPLAHLSWHTTYLLFLLIVPLLMVVTVPLWLAVLDMNVSREWILVLTILTMFSWPMMWAFRLCQPTLLIAFILAAGCYLMRRGYYALSGVAFGCATVKPQLILPLIGFLLLWTVLHRRLRFAVAFAVTSSLLLAGALWRVPGWIPHWRKAMAAMYVHDVQTRPTLQFIFGHTLGTVLMVCVGVAGIYLLWRLRNCPMGSAEFGVAIAFALALAVSLIPNNIAMIYNQVLLLPGILVLLRDPVKNVVSDVARKCAFLTGIAFLNPVLPILVAAAVGANAFSNVGAKEHAREENARLAI